MAPLMIWALANHHTVLAFFVFLTAGFSDALDGLLARLLDQRSKLGAVLDPIADKLLLGSAFAATAWTGDVPVWLAALVIARDALLVAGIGLAVCLGRSVRFSPIPVSKLATLFQIAFIAVILGTRAFDEPFAVLENVLMWVVALFTTFSALAYGVSGLRTLATPTQ